MSREIIVLRKLYRNLPREGVLNTTAYVNLRQLLEFGLRGGIERRPLRLQIRALGVGLRTDRDVFTGGHRHGPRHKPRDARNQDAISVGRSRRNANNQTGGRDDAVIGAQYGRAQPADSMDEMAFARLPEAFHTHRSVVSVLPNRPEQGLPSRRRAL